MDWLIGIFFAGYIMIKFANIKYAHIIQTLQALITLFLRHDSTDST